MEPCPGTPGVIFNTEELPTIVEVLGQYVHDQRILHTRNAHDTYRDLIAIRHEQYGYWGGAFVPADEALTVGKMLEEQSQRTDPPTPLVVPLGILGMVYVDAPASSRRKHAMAAQIEKTVRKSRTLQS